MMLSNWNITIKTRKNQDQQCGWRPACKTHHAQERQSEPEEKGSTDSSKAEMLCFHLNNSSLRVVPVSKRKGTYNFYHCFTAPESSHVSVSVLLKASVPLLVLVWAHPSMTCILIHSADKSKHLQIYFIFFYWKYSWFKYTFYCWLRRLCLKTCLSFPNRCLYGLGNNSVILGADLERGPPSPWGWLKHCGIWQHQPLSSRISLLTFLGLNCYSATSAFPTTPLQNILQMFPLKQTNKQKQQFTR